MTSSDFKKSVRFIKVGVNVSDVAFRPLTVMLDVVGEALITSLGPGAQSLARIIVKGNNVVSHFFLPFYETW
ncbi:MAG: hypothetical protein CMF74_10195 [Maricaulis sp.]|nr:hypothetical protein [Maricaulis sp.]